MAGAAAGPERQSRVASIAAPAALLGRQLLLLSSGQVDKREDLLLQNPALLFCLLEAQDQQGNRARPLPLAARLQQADEGWLHTLLTELSLQLLLAGNDGKHQSRHRFWQQARLTALLARLLAERSGLADPRRSERCALLLDCGLLLPGEQDPIAAGEALLRSWRVEQECIDALRYQRVALDEILDATPVVRLAWLARRLNTVDATGLAEAQAAAASLAGLAAAEVDALVQDAQAAFREELRNSGASQQELLDADPSAAARERFEQGVRDDLQRLQGQLLCDIALRALDTLETATAEDLRPVLARALQQAAVEPRFVLLANQAGGDRQRLQTLCGNDIDELPSELGLQLVPGRSALADLVLAGELGELATTQPGLSVIDRQLLELLGGSLLCETVASDAGHIVLLLAANPAYARCELVRAFVQRKLAAFLETLLASAPGSVDALLYRQRVREAVHEANNPLAIVKNYLQILHMKLGDSGAAREIDIIHGEIDRVAAILAGLRERPRPAPSHDVDLNALVRSLQPIFGQAFSTEHTVEIRLDLADDPLQVHAQPDALKQILTNLVKNAAEAFTAGGNIVLATRRNVYQNGALYTQLSVADDGPGMQPAQLARLFSHGNSTKGRKHRGSGLAIVKRLVDDMAGHITCQSDSKGTVLSILLPQRP